MELEGIYVPNITPFTRKGEINFYALEAFIEFLLEADISGLVVNASTGEAPLLSQEERVDLISFVREKVAGRGAVIAGTGVVGTRETITLTNDALEAGADAALVATPYFFRPKEEEIYKHFTSLLTSVEIPIILYNVPKFTGYSVSPKVVDQIADDCSNLIGIKDSSSNPGNMAENLRLFGNKISVLSGAADMTLPTLAMGGKGAILAVANAIPKTCVQLYKASVEGLLKKAGRLQ
ncbi:MAG: dihydrodipicolinate synthase family protein, partial [Candidatus Bathyarchaeota archaeon]